MSSMSSAPRNIGTQCENIDLESASDNVTITKGLWLKGSLKKYFGLGVQVSDPLLNVVKWIAYVTEVQWEIFLIFTKFNIFPLQDWCHCYSGFAPAPIFPGRHHERICDLPRLRVLPHLCHRLHNRWPDGLLLPALHVGQAFQAPASWSATGNQALCQINLRKAIVT